MSKILERLKQAEAQRNRVESGSRAGAIAGEKADAEELLAQQAAQRVEAEARALAGARERERQAERGLAHARARAAAEEQARQMAAQRIAAERAAAAMEAERALVEKAAQRARLRPGRGRRLWLGAGIAAAVAVAAGLLMRGDGPREMQAAIPASTGKLELRLDRDAHAFAARATRERQQ